jgi:UDP-2,3-diacylglucosamine pyrophosphatase LpxH
MSQHSKSWFLSDLHLLARRSSAPSMEKAIHQAAREAHTLVLGGDIFDFRWRTKLSMDEALDQSVHWLERLIENNTAARYHYLLGNHDSHPDFVERLQRLSEQLPRFQWHRHMLRIDKSIFLHGDVVDRKIRAGEIHHDIVDSRRSSKEERPDPHPFAHKLYDAAVGARLHRVAIQVAKRKEVVLRRLKHYLDAHDAGLESGVEQVFFGHTHRRLSNIRYGGMRFHNPGAAIKGLPFEIIETGLPHPDLLDEAHG